MLDSFNQLSYFQLSFFLTLSNFYSESRTPSPDRSGYPTVKPRTARNEPGAAERGVIAESRFPATKKIRPENSERICISRNFRNLIGFRNL